MPTWGQGLSHDGLLLKDDVLDVRLGGVLTSRTVSVRDTGRLRPLYAQMGRGVVSSTADPDDLDTRLSSVAALADPMRRALYRYVIGQPQPVSREQAAANTGLALHVAKFHLDKLAANGLLESEYRRPPGRVGPGAGRPTKWYRRSEREIVVTLPARRYDIAGQVMAEAITIAVASDARLLTHYAKRLTTSEGG